MVMCSLPVYFELPVLSAEVFREDADVFLLGEGLYPGGRYLADFSWDWFAMSECSGAALEVEEVDNVTAAVVVMIVLGL